jgi:hypothetical protein
MQILKALCTSTECHLANRCGRHVNNYQKSGSEHPEYKDFKDACNDSNNVNFKELKC